VTCRGSAADRTSRKFIGTHPLDPRRAAITPQCALWYSSEGRATGRNRSARNSSTLSWRGIAARRRDMRGRHPGGLTGALAYILRIGGQRGDRPLHGGWLVHFGPPSGIPHLVCILRESGARAFIPDYRLAPEHRSGGRMTRCWHVIKDVREGPFASGCADGRTPMEAVSRSVLASRVTGEAEPYDRNSCRSRE